MTEAELYGDGVEGDARLAVVLDEQHGPLEYHLCDWSFGGMDDHCTRRVFLADVLAIAAIRDHWRSMLPPWVSVVHDTIGMFAVYDLTRATVEPLGEPYPTELAALHAYFASTKK